MVRLIIYAAVFGATYKKTAAGEKPFFLWIASALLLATLI